MENKNVSILLIFLILIYPWLFLVFQGIYIAEGGYWIVSYQDFFTEPEISKTVFYSWLTAFFGGVSNYLFGWMGWVGFKIANVLVMYAILYIVYNMLRAYSGKNLLLFLLLLTEIFVHINTYKYINYYSLTALFYLLGAFFLYKGLIANNLTHFFVSGLFLGLNIFIRFPNLLGIGLVLVIIYYGMATRSSIRDSINKSVVLIVGYVIAIPSILLLMKLLGHYELYLEAISALSSSASDSSSSHSTLHLLYITLTGQIKAILHCILLLLIIAVFLWGSRFRIDSKKWNWIKLSLFVPIFVVFLLILSKVEYSNYYQVYLGIVGMLYLLLLIITYKSFREKPEFGAIALMAFLILEMVPLGSFTQLIQSIYGMYLAIPVAFIYIFSLTQVKVGPLKIKENELKFMRILIISSLLLYSLIVTNFYYSGGEKKRWTMLSSINYPPLQGTLVTKEKAETLNDLIENINRHEDKYDYILTYEEISTVQYFTDLKPYLSNLYPFFYTVTNLKKNLKIASMKKTLPLVVRAKTQVTRRGWPKNAQPIDRENPHTRYHREVIEDFLHQNNYQTVWENRNFELLVPTKE